jgi:hypothetical protein
MFCAEIVGAGRVNHCAWRVGGFVTVGFGVAVDVEVEVGNGVSVAVFTALTGKVDGRVIALVGCILLWPHPETRRQKTSRRKNERTFFMLITF